MRFGRRCIPFWTAYILGFFLLFIVLQKYAYSIENISENGFLFEVSVYFAFLEY
jgi:hypothetical protein